MKVVPTVANAAWSAANLPSYLRFVHALDRPRAAQEQLLHGYLRQNAGTDFGQRHGFAHIDAVAAFQQRVPIRDYDELAPEIDRIAAGERNVLTAEPVTRLAASSGSTRARKLIPYTPSLQREFNLAIGPWIADLYRSDPSLTMGCAYWSITPVVSQSAGEVRSPHLPPIGFEEDSAYLGGWRKRLVDSVMAVPADVRRLADIDAFRFATLRYLLRRRDLRLISVWHPSFLTLLLDSAAARWDELVDDLARDDARRAAELRRTGPNAWSRVWPDLALISCWADAHAAGPAQALGQRVPDIQVQPKGLLATEAFVTIPFRGGWPLAVRSHFFEFIEENGSVRLADELRVGTRYAVVVTTGAGLWRYRLGDSVEVSGFVGRTPSLRFIGRNDFVMDRFGEKLNEAFVGRAIRRTLAETDVHAVFSMLAPDGNRYTLFIRSGDPLPPGLAARLDIALSENPHYAYCRRLRQLQSPSVFAICGDAYEQYVHALRNSGTRMGDIKAASLSARSDWAAVFAGAYSL